MGKAQTVNSPAIAGTRRRIRVPELTEFFVGYQYNHLNVDRPVFGEAAPKTYVSISGNLQ